MNVSCDCYSMSPAPILFKSECEFKLLLCIQFDSSVDIWTADLEFNVTWNDGFKQKSSLLYADTSLGNHAIGNC